MANKIKLNHFFFKQKNKLSIFFVATIILSLFDGNVHANREIKTKIGRSNLQYGFPSLTGINMSGFYIGLSGGFSNTQVDHHVINENLYPKEYLYDPNTWMLDIKSHAGKNQSAYQGMIGFGQQIQSLYIGAEAYVGHSLVNVTVFDNTQSGSAIGLWKASIQRGLFYGFAPRVGYIISPFVLAYLGANIEMGKWKVQVIPDPSIQDNLGNLYRGTQYGSQATFIGGKYYSLSYLK